MDKKATINDVARAAGTSVTTVSRVMNNVDYPVSSELRERIKQAARALSYVPNTAAKNLRKNTSADVGVIIPNITNLFYPQTVLGIESSVRDSGCNLLLFNTLRSKQRENECLEMLCERQVKGVIISPVSNTIDNIQKYINRGMHFVLLDQHIEGVSCPSLNFDSRKGARIAMRPFFDNGHRRIAFATTPLTRWTREEIHRGYREVLREKEVEYDPALIFVAGDESETEDANYEVDAGRDIAESFLAARCDATAILCVNDMVAFGVIKTLANRGVRVPQDISVIGFDDVPFAGVYLPSLTTIRYPAYETGKLAAMLLLENMNNSSAPVELNMRMEPRFIERDTVFAIGAAAAAT